MNAVPATRKRSKHACKNCRRKKARCPAERPVCSFCERLNQVCEYDGPPAQDQSTKAILQPKSSKLAERVAELEFRIAMLSDTSGSASSSMTPSLSPQNRALFDLPSDFLINDDLFQADNPSSDLFSLPLAHFDRTRRKHQGLPPDHTVLAAIDAYFRTCHNYPCTFFDEVEFRNKYACGSIPTFLLLALVASVARLLTDPWFEDDHATAAELMAQAAWQQILADIFPKDDAHSVELVQTTGLLSLLDFRNAKNQAGILKLRIAITIAQNLQLNLDPSPSLPSFEQAEQRHVFWTLYMMDRVSALVLDRPYLISDDECSLRLPEDMPEIHMTRCDQMPCLNDSMVSAVPVHSHYAKISIAMSTLGSIIFFCHGSRLRFGQDSIQESSLYSGLLSQIDRLGEILQQDTSNKDSSSSGVTEKSEQSNQAELPSTFQFRYAKTAFHIAQIFINHPFLLRRHPHLAKLSHDSNFLHHRLSICQQHAVDVLQLVDTGQQAGTIPHTQLFPGWIIFSVAIVHCLFMHSPDMIAAQTSKECFKWCQTMLCDLSLVDGTSQSQRYSIMLDFLGRNAGFSSWFVDPSFPRFNHPSKSNSYWRFMDFDWLCEQFCVGASPFSSVKLSGTAAPQKPKLGATARITASGNLVSNTRHPLTPQSMDTNAQAAQEDGSGYIADSRPLHPTSFPLQVFGFPGEPKFQ